MPTRRIHSSVSGTLGLLQSLLSGLCATQQSALYSLLHDLGKGMDLPGSQWHHLRRTGRHYRPLWAERGREQRTSRPGIPATRLPAQNQSPRRQHRVLASSCMGHPFLSPRPQTRHLETDETDLAPDTPKSTPCYCYLKEIKLTREKLQIKREG